MLAWEQSITSALLRRLPVLAVAFASAYLAVATPWGAHGAAFTANSTVDAADANPGDGVCATAAGDCTLRAAIQETNVIPGPDSITLPAETYVIRTDFGFREDAAASGDLDIAGDLEIRGAGADQTFIDGGRFIHFGDRESTFEAKLATVVMSDLTIMNGGMALIVGGAVLNNGGTLTLNSVIVRENVAFLGGGIANSGTLTVNGGAIIQNLGFPGTAGGGGIFNDGTLALTGVEFTGNSAGMTGGALVNAGVATLTNVTLSDNLSNGGGAIYNGGVMEVSASTMSGNPDQAIYNEGSLTITNSTISGNGRGIFNRDVASLKNVTLISNTTEGIFNDNAPLPPAGLPPPGLLLTVQNTIVAGNGGGNCGDSNPDLDSIVSDGHNLSGDASCSFNGPGDLQNTDPLLGPLADNGGATQTHALLSGSPALDAGGSAGCPATDQRGFSRPFDGDGDGQAVCDIGAYESHNCLGDVSADGVVDSFDVRLVARSLHSEPGSKRWNHAADVNGDGSVEANDLHIVLRARQSGACG